MLTWRQYGRLCLVLYVPLLLAGFIFFSIRFQDARIYHILCEYSNCRRAGSVDGFLYKYIKNNGSPWFEIHSKKFGETTDSWANTLFPALIVEASGLLLNVEIMDTRISSTILLPRSDLDKVRIGLNGKKTYIWINETKEFKVYDDNNNNVSMRCRDLTFSDKIDTYYSWCYGDSWAGEVFFKSDDIIMNAIRESLIKQKNSIQYDYLFAQLVMYPIFIWLFIIISGLAWVTKQAVSFVKAG